MDKFCVRSIIGTNEHLTLLHRPLHGADTLAREVER